MLFRFIILLGISLIKKRNQLVDKNFIQLSLYALVTSLIAFIAITFNDTPDTAYTTYIISMLVWLGGAYTVCSIIKRIHGKVDIILISQYIIAVCIIQCALALIIDMNPSIKQIIDNYIEQDAIFLNNVKRIYGIGASLDVAGGRFSCAIVMVVYIISRKGYKSKWYTNIYYMFAFLWISIVGNMVARTTSVGVGVAFIYMIFELRPHNGKIIGESLVFWKWLALLLIIFIPVGIYLYNSVPEIRSNIRFAFEGFFSLVEKGKWEVGSNETLRNMYVYPENIKTWIIGDGYFSNPRSIETYTGETTRYGYYMGTDVGYLRFIFYFGVIGLISISLVMIKGVQFCMNQNQNHKILFLLIIVMNFIIWFKVSTDLFPVIALYFCINESSEQNLERQ